MSHNVIVILDDRVAPPSEIVAILGNLPFSQIVRRRKRFWQELQLAAETAHCDFQIIETDKEAQTLARRIESRESKVFYLILPSCIAPLHIERLAAVIQKSAFALETMFLAPISFDEAPMLLKTEDAIAFLRAKTGEDRRDILLRLAETAPIMVDHLAMVDIRKPRNLLQFLIGSTEARHFNSTAVDSGIFRKKSSDVTKMKGEYLYFHVAPEEMKRFLVPTFDFWEKDGQAGYSMEHLPVPDVALQFIHGAFQPADFDLLLDTFFAFLSSRKKGTANHEKTFTQGRAHILGKLNARIEHFLRTDEGRRLDAILIASGPRGGIRDMRDAAEPFIEKALEQFPDPHLVFGHGDPCFSNILFDKRLGLMRLIDPRGACNFEDGLMHPLYDVAKFSHSVLGGYDFINNDLFNCCLDDTLTLECHLDAGGPPLWAQDAFCQRLKEKAIDIAAVRAVELSLFLSMLPLHSDRPKKLVGFALKAATILDDLEKTA